VQYTCEVRSVPATNVNRLPVIFAVRITVARPPALLPVVPQLPDPIIVTLSYFRSEVPVTLLFYAFGVFDADAIGARVQRTAQWADLPTLRRLLYATVQHTAAVRNRVEALTVLAGFMTQQQTHSRHGGARSTNATTSPATAAEELLSANVLPHLVTTENKLEYLAYLVGTLLNHLFLPSARQSHFFDKDHMGNKRMDVCGTLLSQQLRNALYRMRGYVERGLAKGMACRSHVSNAARELPANQARGIATIQNAIVSYFVSHSITKKVQYAMSTGNWNTGMQGGHASGNSMAAHVATKTGVIQQLTHFNASSILSHIRRVCTPLDRVGRGSKPRDLQVSHYGFLCPVCDRSPEPDCLPIYN
jgi:DNA-directed RNA polymerase beta subunit